MTDGEFIVYEAFKAGKLIARLEVHIDYHAHLGKYVEGEVRHCLDALFDIKHVELKRRTT